MTRVLAVADEVDEVLFGAGLDDLGPDLVVSCGDLPYDDLEYLVTRLSVPLVYVPGKHDPELRQRREPAWPPTLGSPHLEDPPGPLGCVNVDGRLEDAGGLRLAGLGGSVRYREGPNQYTQAEMRRRARRLRRRAGVRRLRDGRGVDLLATHAPPFGLGDEDDPAHVGIQALHALIRRLSPSLLLHGHVHPYGREQPDRMIGSTRVVNVVPWRILTAEPRTARGRRTDG